MNNNGLSMRFDPTTGKLVPGPSNSELFAQQNPNSTPQASISRMIDAIFNAPKSNTQLVGRTAGTAFNKAISPIEQPVQKILDQFLKSPAASKLYDTLFSGQPGSFLNPNHHMNQDNLSPSWMKS